MKSIDQLIQRRIVRRNVCSHPRPPSLTIRFAIKIVNGVRESIVSAAIPPEVTIQRNIPINISYTAETREVWRVVRDEGGSSSPGGVRARGSAEHERAKDSVVITLPRFFRGVRLLIPRVYIYACLGRTTTTTIIRRRRRRRVERYTRTKCKGEEEQGGVRIPKMEGIEERREKRGRGGRNE